MNILSPSVAALSVCFRISTKLFANTKELTFMDEQQEIWLFTLSLVIQLPFCGVSVHGALKLPSRSSKGRSSRWSDPHL